MDLVKGAQDRIVAFASFAKTSRSLGAQASASSVVHSKNAKQFLARVTVHQKSLSSQCWCHDSLRPTLSMLSFKEVDEKSTQFWGMETVYFVPCPMLS